MQGSNNKTWVINLSSKPLTKGQELLLAKGPNFAIAPINPPSVELISVVKLIYHKLTDQDGQELRTDVNYLLRKAQQPRCNITKPERKVLKELMENQDRIILTIDKGVAMVVMDRKDYNDNINKLLSSSAYKAIPTYSTSKIKAQLILKLRKIKRETNMGEGMYKAMYPTGCTAPKFYRLPKIHKTNNPLKPIVSSRGSVTVLTKVLKPLVGKLLHHIQSTGDFVSKFREVTFLPRKCLTSYDVTTLFTSVPIDPVLTIIKDILEKDDTLCNRTVLSIQNIIELLEVLSA